MSGLRRLIREVHRRSLWQVLGIYVVGSWVALQVVDVLKQNFGLPEWFPAFALALLVLGLPIVLATAFVQEGIGGDAADEAGRARVGATGAERGRPPAGEGKTPGRLFTWRNALLGGAGAALLWGGVALGWLLFGRDGAGEAAGAAGIPTTAGARTSRAAEEPRSIAVLPFTSVRTDEESQAFVTGIHDDLLTQLSKIGGLTVISRTSVMKYRDTELGIPEIAKELGVATVLEGGVQRAGDRVRLNVQLIEAATDRHLWAETYDEELTAANVFAMQSDLARKIAGALKATLTPEEARRLETLPTESLEAYDLYTRGRYVLDSRGSTREGVEAAAELFRRSIAADSAFAPAHEGLASAYFRLWILGYATEGEALPKARAAADRALALDPELAEAHARLAGLLQVEGRLGEAETAVRRALELNPGSAAAHVVYSGMLLELGRPEEAVREARRAVELDPLSAGTRRALVARLAFARRNDEAIEEAKRLLELEPNEADAWYYSAMAHTLKGEHAKAIEEGHRALEMNPSDPYYPAGIAWAYARAAGRDSALAYAKRAEEAGVPLKEIALVRAALGDLDQAFEYLERGYASEPATLRNMRSDPASDPLRADPRWGALMKRLGVEESR